MVRRLMLLLALVAVLAMHGLVSAHGTHAVAPAAAATAGAVGAGAPDRHEQHAPDGSPMVVELAAAGCAFAVLVARRATTRRRAAGVRIRMWARLCPSQTSWVPDPPVPRLAVRVPIF